MSAWQSFYGVRRQRSLRRRRRFPEVLSDAQESGVALAFFAHP